jgi:hypothetical protein
VKPGISRGMSILDGMILIGGTAIGFAAIRLGDVTPYLGQYPTWSSALMAFTNITSWLSTLAPVVALWSLSFILLRLRQPRPRRRRLFDQPGFVASVATAAGLVFMGWLLFPALLGNQPGALWNGQAYVLDAWGTTVVFSIMGCGGAVASSWMILAIGGRWRPEPGWIDRIGRGLGAYWIAMSLDLTALHLIDLYRCGAF